MTLIEEEEIAVMVKKTLADALPLSNTPGPVDVTGEEGFAALSLLYLDARGDLFIKEQQNQPLVWDGTDVTIGPTNSDHITIDTTSIKFFKDSDTEKGSLSGDTWTLGTSTAYHTSITNTEVQLKNSSTVLTEIAGGNATIGEVAADKGNVHILAGSPAKIQLRNNTSVLAQLSSSTLTLGATTAEHISISGSDIQFYNASVETGSLTGTTWVLGQIGSGNKNIEISNSEINLRENETDIVTFSITSDAPSLKFEDIGSTKFWEFRKDHNTNEFTVRPETNSIFKFMDESGTSTTTLGIDTTDTTFNSASKTKNSIVTQHMGGTSGMPINSIMGGTDEVYGDGATVDLFGFTLATSQVMYCDLTIMSWSPGYTQEAQGVSRWRIIIYKDAAGNVYPSSDSDKVDEVEAWREFDKVTSDAVAIAAGGGTNEYKITADREYSASAGQTRLIYKADIIGTVTAITNLQV